MSPTFHWFLPTSGAHYQVAGATGLEPPAPPPMIYFGGPSPAAGEVAARRAEVYLDEAYWFGEGVLPELAWPGHLGEQAAGRPAVPGTADRAAATA